MEKSLGCHGNTNDFLVVAREQASLGESGMGPNDLPAAGLVVGLQNVRAIDFLVAFGIEVGQDQVALVVANHGLRALRDEKGVGAIRLLPARRAVAFPKHLTGLGLKSAKPAVGADAIEPTARKQRREQPEVSGLQ